MFRYPIIISEKSGMNGTLSLNQAEDYDGEHNMVQMVEAAGIEPAVPLLLRYFTSLSITKAKRIHFFKKIETGSYERNTTLEFELVTSLP